MAETKRKIIDGRFSLLCGSIGGRLRLYRAGPDKDLVVSMEIEIFPYKAVIPGSAPAPARG
jgi:hypothetical protein